MISDEDDITVSLGHSSISKAVYQNLTKYIGFELSDEDETDEAESNLWKLNVTLPYPDSQASGDLTLSVGDNHSGDVTTTRLIIEQEGINMSPFFDPVPKSVKAYPGQDVLINTQARGSTPINVSITKNMLCYIYA